MFPPAADPALSSLYLPDNQQRFRDRVALYLESGRYSRVRVEALELDETRLRLRLRLLPTGGLYNQRPDTWIIGGPVDTWRCSQDLLQWTCLHIGTVFFDPSLIEAVVRWGEAVPDRVYNRQAIGQCIRSYMLSLLRPHLSGELELFWQQRQLGRLRDNCLLKCTWYVGLYPWVRGRSASLDIDSGLEHDLRAYAQDFTAPMPASVQFDKAFYENWSLTTARGMSIPIMLPPLVDFKHAAVCWRWQGSIGIGFDERQ